MGNEHIIEIIDRESLARLSEAELSSIRAHAEACLDCGRAFEAAQVSQLLVKERATEIFEPSPFFHTRVLATIRERQMAKESWSLSKLWRAAGALASAMAVLVAALALLTFAIPGSSVAPGTASVVAAYSAEEVILGPNEPADEQVSDAQLLTTIYDDEE